MQQDRKDIAAVAISTRMRRLSRRQLLDRGIGIGAFLLTAGSAKAVDPMHANMDVSPTMDMSPAICMASDNAAARERVLAPSQVVHDAYGMVENFETLFPETATRFLAIDGQRRPMIEMRPGEVRRKRIFNAAYQDDMLLELENHDLRAVAYDGIQLGAMQPIKQLPIAPGHRADVLVKAGPAGTYALNAEPHDQGHSSPVGSLARLVAAGAPVDTNLPAALPPPSRETIRDSEVTNHRKLTFSATAPEANAAGRWREFAFFIDGKKFDPNRIDQRVKLGAFEEWTVVNTHEHDDHVFHIHTNPFQVVSVDGKRSDAPEWRDSVIVARKRGEVVFRSRFLDFTGVFMVHCHMMNREEMGMMQTVEVHEDPLSEK